MRIILSSLLIMAFCHTMSKQEESNDSTERRHFYGTMVNFKDPKVQVYIQALMLNAISCRRRSQTYPDSVRAYFTNSPPNDYSGRCFVACMLESGLVIYNGRVDTNLLVHLTSLVNGKNSRVVSKLKQVAIECLGTIEGITDRCELAATYNNCLNRNMKQFHFPKMVADKIIKDMHFAS